MSKGPLARLGVASRALALTAVGVSAALALPAGAPASPGAAPASTVRLQASMRPERLGAGTTVSIGFRISAPAAAQFAPLDGFDVRLPAGMGFAATTLGLATCSAARLLADGARACPSDSVMGFGSAEVQAPFGAQLVRERARMSIFMTQPVGGHTTMLFYFDGRAPVIAPLVLQSEVLTPADTFDSVLSTAIPAIPTAPDGADVEIVALESNIGPEHVSYVKRVHGHAVSYRPEGLNVPEACPRGGFVFAAELRFEDGSHVAASDTVPCPRQPAARHAGRRRGA